MLDENKTKWNGMECIEQMIGCIAWQLAFFYYFNIATYVMCYLNFNTLMFSFFLIDVMSFSFSNRLLIVLTLNFCFCPFLGGYSTVDNSSAMCDELFPLLGVPVYTTSKWAAIFKTRKVGHFPKINFNYIVWYLLLHRSKDAALNEKIFLKSTFELFYWN